ncbi:MAG: hypothetical protein O3C57_06130 [Verrucomicrobia bacterium]|nr:hypothetical protein [Verrucomicrobiota bacterium]
MRREKVYEAHRSHLYQLLSRMGWSHRNVSLFHCVVAVAQGVGAVFLVELEPQRRVFVFLPYLVFNVAYAVFVLGRARAKGLV